MPTNPGTPEDPPPPPQNGPPPVERLADTALTLCWWATLLPTSDGRLPTIGAVAGYLTTSSSTPSSTWGDVESSALRLALRTLQWWRVNPVDDADARAPDVDAVIGWLVAEIEGRL